MKKYRCPHCLGRAITKTSGLMSQVGLIYCVGEGQCKHSGGEDNFIVEEYVEMPVALTAENGAKAALMGEFVIKGVKYRDEVVVDWTTIKAIYRAAVEHFNQDLKVTDEQQRICTK